MDVHMPGTDDPFASQQFGEGWLMKRPYTRSPGTRLHLICQVSQLHPRLPHEGRQRILKAHGETPTGSRLQLAIASVIWSGLTVQAVPSVHLPKMIQVNERNNLLI